MDFGDFSDERNIEHSQSYMTYLCEQIKPPNQSPNELICQKWFKIASDHCRDLVFKRKKIQFWSEVLNLNFLFPNTGSSLLNPQPHVRIQPNLLSADECNYLLDEIATDYVDSMPKFSYLVDENLFLHRVVKSLFAFLLVLLAYTIFKSHSEVFRRSLVLSSKGRQTSGNDALLKNHLQEIKMLKVDRYPHQIKVESGVPTIAIRLSKQALARAMAWYVKADHQLHNGQGNNVSTTTELNPQQPAFQIKRFINKSPKCRIVFDIDLTDTDTDSDYSHDETAQVPKYPDVNKKMQRIPIRRSTKERRTPKSSRNHTAKCPDSIPTPCAYLLHSKNRTNVCPRKP